MTYLQPPMRRKFSRFGLLNVLLASALALAASGCATRAPISKTSEAPLATIVSQDKNYTIGTSRNVSVGEVAIRVRLKTQNAKALGYAEANEPFTFSSRWETVKVESGKQYSIAGTTQLEGREFFIVVVPSWLGQGLGILVEPDGTIQETALNMGPINAGGWVLVGLGGIGVKGIVIRPKYKATPDSARLAPGREWVPSASAGEADQNFDLLYYGSTTDEIKFVAREYSPDDLVKPVNSQEVSYDRRESVIRFRNISIRIDNVAGSALSYTVIDDVAK